MKIKFKKTIANRVKCWGYSHHAINVLGRLGFDKVMKALDIENEIFDLIVFLREDILNYLKNKYFKDIYEERFS
jgi:hypothetical protein